MTSRYLSSGCLAAIVVVVSRRAAKSMFAYHWSQAYYYCIYAAVIYFTIASLLSLNFLGTCRGHLKPDVALSTTLRSLLLHSMAFLAILFLGAVVFSRLEGWSYLDSLYWADVTLLTIGFGDIAPTTTLGRALLFPYALAGIVCLGLTVSLLRKLVLDKGSSTLHFRRLANLRDDYLKQRDCAGERIHHSDRLHVAGILGVTVSNPHRRSPGTRHPSAPNAD